MSNPVIQIDIGKWVERAKSDEFKYQQRRTVEIVLNAIAMATPIKSRLFLKGGLLMGLAYDSPRQTVDIDLTTSLEVDAEVGQYVQRQLDQALPIAATTLGYADLLVWIHSLRTLPKNIFVDAQFPALKIKIASAHRSFWDERHMLAGKAPPVLIDLDISFNEPSMSTIQILALTGDREIMSYGLVDLIAEKYRAILQQVPRNRYRPQDVYDLDRLISLQEVGETLQMKIVAEIRRKSRARDIEPHLNALDDPEVKSRSGAEWKMMELDLAKLPDFEESYTKVTEFYRNLPWFAH